MSTLTSKTVASAVTKSYARTTFLWDNGTGLGIKLNPSGRHLYVVQTRINGKSVRRTLGSADMGLAEARRQARATRTTLEQGQDVAVLRRRQRSLGVAAGPAALTFSVVREQYLQHAKTRLKTYDQIRRILSRSELAEWADMPLEAISRSMVRDAYQNIVTGVKARAAGQEQRGQLRQGTGQIANRLLAHLSAMTVWAIEHYQLEISNPFSGWKAMRVPETRRLGKIDPQDAGKILAAIRTLSRPWNVILELVLLLGCRRGEIQALQWSQIRNSDNPRLELGASTKAGDQIDRTIALPPRAASLIASLKRGKGTHVFGGDGPLGSDSRVDKKMYERAGLSYAWTPHAWRGLLADWLHEHAGASSDELRAILGHVVSGGALSHYLSKPPVARMRELLTRWESMLCWS